MEWTDEAFVLGVRRHGETSVILEAMTRDHGRHLGVVRGGRSRSLQPVLQPGNAVRLVWRARLDEHIGAYVVEGVAQHAARFLASRLALYGMSHIAALVRLLPERDPHPDLFAALGETLAVLDDAELAPAMVARFEFAMLDELGFGLDLSACAVTGGDEDLVYVSPRTGRAVSRGAGAPWADRLLALPGFLHGKGGATRDDVAAALHLTGHFLDRHVLAPRGLAFAEGRAMLLAALSDPSGRR